MQTETKGIFKGIFSAKADSQAARQIKELTKELKDLRSQRHQLEKDNKELSDRVAQLKSEIAGAEAIAEAFQAEIRASKARIEELPKRLKELEASKEVLIAEINQCQAGIKTAMNNIKNFLAMRARLESELMDIINEKAVVLKKLKDMQQGIRSVELQKEQKAPHLKEYDLVLRQLSRAFKEVENRFDISIKFSTKKFASGAE